MNNFNFIVVEGRLTRDAAFKYTSKGKAILTFSLANNYNRMKEGKKENAVNFFNVTVWDNLAEVMSKYLKKGTRIILSGKLTLELYTAQSGEQKLTAKIQANNIDFVNAGEKSYNKTSYGEKKFANPA